MGKTAYMHTHFDESMKYITRAPMLRAKTNTTCKRRQTFHYSRAGTREFALLIGSND